MKTAVTVPQTAPVTTTVKPGVVQRKCTCGGTCDSCREPEKENVAGVVQRQASNPGRTTMSAGRPVSAPLATQIHSAAEGGGQRLPARTKSVMQARFGNRDFSGVRVHADSTADHLARQLGAEAFTVGNNIFFAGHRYDPQSASGQRLLAHELTHVVQQGGSAGSAVQTKLELGAPDSAAECEADRVAEAVVGGAPVGPIGSAGVGLVQRQVAPCASEDCQAGAAPPPQPCSCPLPGGGERVILPTSEPLDVPAQKALATEGDLDYLLALYRNSAQHHALRSTHAGRSTDTERLWGLWRQGRSQVAQQAQQVESSCRSQCSPDHIIELQVNGADNANNLRLLQRDHNSLAGSQIAGQLSSLRSRYLTGSVAGNSFVEFTAIRERPGTNAGPDVCLQNEPLRRPGGRVSAAAGSQELKFSVGGNPVVIGYAANGYVDANSRFAVAGLELRTVSTDSDGKARITAGISPHVRRLPLKGHPAPINLFVDGPQPTQAGAAFPPLRLDAATAPVQLTFPHLSEASLTPAIERGQFVAAGNFTPSLPLLRFVQVHLEIRNEQFQGGVTIPPEHLRRALPIPGLTIDPVTLAIAVADGVFSVTGGFGFRYGTFANGQVSASFTPARGFAASGDIAVHIPGIDEATGEAHVRDGRFGARLTVGTNKVKFPGVRSANLVVDVADGNLAGTGTVILGIPGLRDASLRFAANSQGQYGITGSATGTIPGLRDPHVDIGYANGALSGTGTAGFVIPGFEGGNIVLRYATGQFSGGASIDYRRGRLSGRITANLSPDHRLSGSGELSYEIVPGLIGIVGLEIRENGTARVAGELRLPDPIILFPERAFSKQLFGVSIDIPIFGISFGSRSIGVIANIAAALNARAGIGPGQLRHPHILAAFDPSSDQGPASFQAGAELYVPAYAELALSVSGGIGVSLLIVKAVGGIRATGAAGLTGALLVPIELHYIGGRFAVDGAAELFAQPHLRFQLDAFVNVVADLLLTTIDVYSKTWKLAGFEWGSDFRIGLRFPIHYVFGEPFNLSLSQVEFIAPRIDTRRLLADLLPK